MKLKVYRYSSQSRTTISAIHIDGEFECFGLEDRYREIKVMGETRIGSGTYTIGLRTVGGHHAKYSNKFPDIHKGMLHVLDVPNFKYILIHIGNGEKDTMGCLLVGQEANNNKLYKGQITSSTSAYTELYSKVIKALDRNEPVTIQYIDL
tara:strand:- start:40 stop:489 length:450 start_codon:yes stop_codon:yes gene_type:complete